VTAREVPEERLFETVPIQKLVMGFDVVFSFLGNACTHKQSYWSTSSEKKHNSAIREGRAILICFDIDRNRANFFDSCRAGRISGIFLAAGSIGLPVLGKGHKSSGNQDSDMNHF
jgi:hypothetical protein